MISRKTAMKDSELLHVLVPYMDMDVSPLSLSLSLTHTHTHSLTHLHTHSLSHTIHQTFMFLSMVPTAVVRDGASLFSSDAKLSI